MPINPGRIIRPCNKSALLFLPRLRGQIAGAIAAIVVNFGESNRVVGVRPFVFTRCCLLGARHLPRYVGQRYLVALSLICSVD